MPSGSVALPSTSATTTKDVLKEYDGLRRSESSKDLPKHARMRRSSSDTHLHYSVNRIRARMMEPKLKTSRSLGIFPFQISSSIIPDSLKSFLFDPETSEDMNIVKDEELVESTEESVESSEQKEHERANWVERILQIRTHWRNRQQESTEGDDICDNDGSGDHAYDDDEGGCVVGCDSEDGDGGGEDEEVTYNRDTFSRFLSPVPWSDTKLYSKLAFLSNMAYVITEIKTVDLRRYYGLQFVTSSLERKAEAMAIREKIDEDSTRVPVVSFDIAKQGLDEENNLAKEQPSSQKSPLRSSVAYEIAASAASYVQSRNKGLSTCGSGSLQEGNCSTDKCGNLLDREAGETATRVYNSEVAACVTASTMTAVVAAGEKEKEEAARNLQSLHSSPCEWFICDDLSTYTRCFVIQGSDSVASWHANLMFEPAKFEGTEVLVHRGIYEAAKGIYEQFMPEITEYLDTYGERAKFQFTGHSLGGSLSLLVHLMLLTRKVVKPSTLRPVVTFGSPFVFCGGNKMLKMLGLDESHIHSVMMHRDIVPRAFSCDYPNHISTLLKRLNGTFRSHPCLVKHKLLYTPLGKLLILQPNEESSPSHPLLPQGSALYYLDKARCRTYASAIKAFLNCPHPVQILSNPGAYGSEGTILRDHDSSNYLKAVNGVLRQNTKMVFTKSRTQRRNNLLWPLLTSPSPHSWNQENSLLVTRAVMTQ